ncbi:uncharacterized protein [Ovis canadensis]|uniref:uncharacterized protein isoform X2 n=1 Tax=Ovis canadensis TaxID=37174 RepID=UPI0038B4AA99
MKTWKSFLTSELQMLSEIVTSPPQDSPHNIKYMASPQYIIAEKISLANNSSRRHTMTNIIEPKRKEEILGGSLGKIKEKPGSGKIISSTQSSPYSFHHSKQYIKRPQEDYENIYISKPKHVGFTIFHSISGKGTKGAQISFRCKIYLRLAEKHMEESTVGKEEKTDYFY